MPLGSANGQPGIESMNSILAIKLLGGPAVILLASMAGRRWGPTIAGLLGGMPLLATCIIGTLWAEYGKEYALVTAMAAPAGLWANSAFMLAMAYASIKLPWPLMLLCGWIVYLIIAVAIAFSGLTDSFWLGLSALGSLFLGLWFMPAPEAPPKIARLPHMELTARVIAAFVLVAGLSITARFLGPELTGVLSGGPVAASVIPAFTQASGDRNAVLLQLRGFLTGLTGFCVFFLILVPLAGVIGAWAALPAAVFSVASAYGTSKIAQKMLDRKLRKRFKSAP